MGNSSRGREILGNDVALGSFHESNPTLDLTPKEIFIMRLVTTLQVAAVLVAMAGVGTLSAEPVAEAPAAVVHESATSAQPLKVGAALPVVPPLRNAKGEAVSLADLTKEKTTLLIFYRGGWCPYCVTHLRELAQIQPELEAAGVQVVALSPDSPETITGHLAKGALPYTILSDSQHEAMKAFGVAFAVDEATQGKLKGYGIDMAKDSGNPDPVLPVPSVFVIGKDGKVAFAQSDADDKKRLSAKAVLAAVNVSPAATELPTP
jgi:peroxiredoxin